MNTYKFGVMKGILYVLVALISAKYLADYNLPAISQGRLTHEHTTTQHFISFAICQLY